MKKILIAIVACILAFGGNAMAQKTVKLGHINSNDLMKIMPGRDSAQTVLQAEVTELENTLKSMQAEAEKRYNDYVANQAGWTELLLVNVFGSGLMITGNSGVGKSPYRGVPEKRTRTTPESRTGTARAYHQPRQKSHRGCGQRGWLHLYPRRRYCCGALFTG